MLGDPRGQSPQAPPAFRTCDQVVLGSSLARPHPHDTLTCMQSLAQFLSALQQELGSALPGQLQLPGGVAMQADRVVVSLQFSAAEGANGQTEFSWAHPPPNANGMLPKPLHTLTLEFKAVQTPIQGGGALPQTEASPAAPPRDQSEIIADRIKDALSLIFGAPGFDSSARATVFRETFDALSADQAEVVIESLSGNAPDNDPAAKRSRGLLLKLLRSAPLDDFEQAKLTLVDVLVQHPLDSVLSLVAREWKTQEDWL
jgi:hypothetical protein